MSKSPRNRSAGSKKPRKSRTKPDAPGAGPELQREDAAGDDARRGIGDNSAGAAASRLTPAQEQELFLSHRSAWNGFQAKLKAAEMFGVDVKAALKADGFTVKMMKIADDLGTVKGEKRVVDDVTDRLKVARWLGHVMGAQLDLFEKRPELRPVVDEAREAGRQASVSGALRKPPHDPGTPGYAAWMDGFDDHQEVLRQGVGRGSGNGGKFGPQVRAMTDAADEAVRKATAAEPEQETPF